TTGSGGVGGVAPPPPPAPPAAPAKAGALSSARAKPLAMRLQRKFQLEANPERARVSFPRNPPQIGRVVFDPARGIEPEFPEADAPRHRGPESMLRFFAMLAEADDTVILDPGLEMRIEAEPRLRRGKQARRPDAARAHFLGEEQIRRIQHGDAGQ